MEKNEKDLKKKGKEEDKPKQDENQKPRMKKPGEEGFIPENDEIGDGSAGIGGTSGI